MYNLGDRVVVEGPRIVLEETNALCTHALSSLLHYVVALDEGADPVNLGLTQPDDPSHAYIQCMDPGKPYTDGGTVIFRIRRNKGQESRE